MGQSDYLKLGSWNVICDRCKFKFKADELQREWTGLMVCGDCWEPRHEQDFVRSRPDQQPLPYTAPESTDTFVSVTYDCANEEYVEYTKQFLDAMPILTINKGYTHGPYTTPSGYEFTVRCTWDII